MEQAYYRWRKEYGELKVDQARRLRPERSEYWLKAGEFITTRSDHTLRWANRQPAFFLLLSPAKPLFHLEPEHIEQHQHREAVEHRSAKQPPHAYTVMSNPTRSGSRVVLPSPEGRNKLRITAANATAAR